MGRQAVRTGRILRAMRWSSFIPTAREPRVFVPMFRAALLGTRSGLVGGLLVALLLSWLFRASVGGAVYATWLAAFLGVCAVRAALLVWMARLPDAALGERHGAINTAGFVVTGTLWGLAGFAFPIDAATWAPFAVLTCQLLMVVMAVPALASYWPCFVAFAAPVQMLAPWTWLPIGPEIALVVGLGCFFNLVVLCLFAARHANAQLATLRLRDERAQMVRDLQDKGDALARSLEVKSRLLAAASHDLRQPLHAMALTLRTASAAQDRGSPVLPTLETLEAMVHSADEMLQSLVEAARGDDPDGHWPLQECGAQVIVDEVVEEQAAHAAERGLLLRVRHGWWTVRSNSVALKRIARNLLSNAIKYTDSGGVLVAVRRRGGDVWLEVWDTGRGIPPEDHERVFAPYRRLEDSPGAQSTAGVGLGLAVVRQLAASLGHRVELRSRPGRGSVFRVWLGPALAEEAEAAAPPAASAALFIRDATLASQVSGLLQQWGLPWRIGQAPGEDEAQDDAAAGAVPLVEAGAFSPSEASRLLAHFERAGRSSIWLGEVAAGQQAPSGLARAQLPLPLEPVRLRAALNRLSVSPLPADAAGQSPANVN